MVMFLILFNFNILLKFSNFLPNYYYSLCLSITDFFTIFYYIFVLNKWLHETNLFERELVNRSGECEGGKNENRDGEQKFARSL